MAGVTIGETFDQRGTAPVPRLPERVEGGPINDIRVVAVDHDAIEAVGRGAIGGGMFNRRHVADRRVFHVEIILTDEDDGELPDRSEIERLVESADIGRAIAEETDSHV